MVHPLIKVMLVGGKGDGLMVSVADNATEISVTPAQYGAEKLKRVALTRGMKKLFG